MQVLNCRERLKEDGVGYHVIANLMIVRLYKTVSTIHQTNTQPNSEPEISISSFIENVTEVTACKYA